MSEEKQREIYDFIRVFTGRPYGADRHPLAYITKTASAVPTITIKPTAFTDGKFTGGEDDVIIEIIQGEDVWADKYDILERQVEELASSILLDTLEERVETEPVETLEDSYKELALFIVKYFDKYFIGEELPKTLNIPLFLVKEPDGEFYLFYLILVQSMSGENTIYNCGVVYDIVPKPIMFKELGNDIYHVISVVGNIDISHKAGRPDKHTLSRAKTDSED